MLGPFRYVRPEFIKCLNIKKELDVRNPFDWYIKVAATNSFRWFLRINH